MAIFEQSISLLRNAILEECPEIGMKYTGIATHLIDMQHFYIVPLTCYRLMPALEKPGNIMKNFDEYSFVIYLSPVLGHHVRGVVQKVRKNMSCIMFAIDYGVTDMEVSHPNIYTPYHHDAESIPGLAQLCALSMCFPRKGGQFTQDAVETFKFFMGQERERLTITVKEKTNYRLGVLVMSSQSNPDDVSTVLAYTNHSVYYPAPL